MFINALYNLWPHGDSIVPGLRDGMAKSAETVFPQYGMSSLVVSHFMAQISLECGAGTELVENLNYSAQRMCQVWPKRFRSIASAAPYAHNPRALADKVYNGRMGNRPGTDDGYNNRGRGATQTTGAYGYDLLARAYGLPADKLAELMAARHTVDQGHMKLADYQAKWPVRLDLIAHPELVNDPAHFLECGVVDFILCGCLPYAKADNVREVTHRLNGGYTNLSDRIAWLARWKHALGV